MENLTMTVKEQEEKYWDTFTFFSKKTLLASQQQ